MPNRPQPFATVRIRSQPFATFRGRPCEVRIAVPMVSSCKFCKRGHFGGCTCCVASFRVAGVALRDIQTCSVTCRKSLCVWGRRGTFATFSEDALQFFRGRWSTLDASIVILRGKRSTLDVSRCVFLRILMSELCQVATRCRFRGRRGIL